jgi:methyl-accepting chemotaxis protein
MEQLVGAGSRATNAAEELVKVQGELNSAAIETAEDLLMRGRIVIGVILLLVVGIGIAAGLVTLRGTRLLKTTAGRLLASSDRIHAAAAQVSSASHMLAQGASKQAASIEETSSSAQEVAAVANQNADTAADTERLMGDAEKVGAESNAALAGMEEAMKRIDASTSNISKVIRVIDEIAFQTNILALNAAVEAARAGEAGMGFAVVADEVRSLAQRSAQAAKETGGMIEECVDSARDGQTRIAEVKRTFAQNETIQGTVKRHSGEIVAASREQARGAEQIARAVQELGQLAETTAAQAEQSAASGRELSDESGSLHSIVGELEAVVGRE